MEGRSTFGERQMRKGLCAVPYVKEEASPRGLTTSAAQVFRVSLALLLITFWYTTKCLSPMAIPRSLFKNNFPNAMIPLEPRKGRLPSNLALGFQGSCPDSHQALVTKK